MKFNYVALLALVVGGALGYGGQFLLQNTGVSSQMPNSAEDKNNKPLYWVAPMDPSYKRDKPGKSPMGMDLVPVYANDSDKKVKPGTVTIDSSVENNLGVKTTSVELEPLAPSISTVGYVGFDQSQLWQINVRVSGWVDNVFVNAVGEQVRQGQVLFTLYSPELVKAQEELLNAYKSGRKVLIRGALERLQALGVDRAQIQTITQQGKPKQTIEFKALSDGVVASLSIREGSYLSPTQTAISAGPLNKVWVETEILERQAHWVKKGSSALMTLDAIPGREWFGEIEYVYPILDPVSRTLKVRIVFPNSDFELKPNMFANVILQPESTEPALTIPNSSVIRSGGMARVVLSEGDGRYRSARIEVGRSAGDKVEVLKGLQEGDSIVNSAHFMLDSESSQTAELSRIQTNDERVWVHGVINSMMLGHRMLNIDHQPVPEWDWPGMTMDFMVNDAINMDDLENGQHIKFEIQKNEQGQFEILNVAKLEHTAPSEVWVLGDVSSLMADFGMITIAHAPVPEWQWSEGEMNFSVNDKTDLSSFSEGEKVRLLLSKQGSEYVLETIEKVEEGK